jgi:hypothetical protein
MRGSREGGRDVRRLRPRIRLAVSGVVVGLCAAAMLMPGSPVPVHAGSTTASVWLQTMDSCEQALDGASYQVVGDNGLNVIVSTPGTGKVGVVSGNCPVEHGDCSSTTTGCVLISGLPPGSYRIHETRTPPANPSNPEGYAACNGGSACQRQETDITVSSSGTASGTTTNVYPDGTVAVYGAWPGTTSSPVVVHNFGLAPPGYNGASECDGDGDADDHSTGSPSSHCQYPESQESAACKPYPWSCTLGLWTPPTTTTTTTTTTSTSSTGTTTTTTTTTTDSTTTDLTSTGTTTSTGSTTTATTTTTSSTASEGCGITSSATGRLRKGSRKTFSLTTAAAGTLGVDVTWTPGATVRLQILGSQGKVLAQTTATGTSLHLDGGMLAAGRYRFRLKLSGTTSVTYTLAVSHC